MNLVPIARLPHPPALFAAGALLLAPPASAEVPPAHSPDAEAARQDAVVPETSVEPGEPPGQEPATAEDEPASDVIEDIKERVARLEEENEELRERLDITAEEVERFELRDVIPRLGDSRYGLGPAASKVYEQEGLSIGGYGELIYQNFDGPTPDRFDLLRAVLYFGYKFNQRWLFNSEVEFEHASTAEDGSVSVEFAYLDYLARQEANARVGLVLLPMGFINEQHEPITFLGTTRPEVERRIIPSTWRENGAGVFGGGGPFEYRAYVVNGMDATGYAANGLRGGRQKGSKALANDLAAVARLDWTHGSGLLLGGSAYYGNAGQDQTNLGSTSTGIFEAHAEYRWRGLWLRALGTVALVDDVAQLNQSLGLTGAQSVGERLEGWYLTAGYDLMRHISRDSQMGLTPYLRWERFDTQAKVPTGFSSDPANDERIFTFGLDFKPIDQIVFKADYQVWDRAEDRFTFVVGYVF